MIDWNDLIGLLRKASELTDQLSGGPECEQERATIGTLLGVLLDAAVELREEEIEKYATPVSGSYIALVKGAEDSEFTVAVNTPLFAVAKECAQEAVHADPKAQALVINLTMGTIADQYMPRDEEQVFAAGQTSLDELTGQ